MNETNNIVLTFNSSFTGEKVRLTIPRANTDIDSVQAQMSMQAIIDGGIVMTSSGRPASIHGAELVLTQRTPLINNA